MGSLFTHSFHHLCSSELSERALVYLVATSREGRAYIIPPARRRKEGDNQATIVAFPQLTSRTVEEWLVRHNDVGQVIGGFQLALDHAGIWLLEKWIRRQVIREQKSKIALPLREVANALPEAMGTMRQALRWMVESWRAEADILSGGGARQQEVARRLREQLALPLEMALTQGILKNELSWFLQEAELGVLLPQLSDVIMVPLRQGLNALQLDDPTQLITFVLYGQLGLLPLQDALVPDKHTGQKVPFQVTCKLTSIRSLPSDTL